MRKFLALSALLLSSVCVVAQSFSVGHKQLTFTDSARANRSVTAEVYYPSNTAGNNVAIATGQFPVLVFGHGFVMSWSSYQTYWDSIVPHGYIMVFPTTETSLSPSHINFGTDIAFLVKTMKKEGINSSSFFHNAISNTSAAMGHSMGGGSAFLAMQQDTSITAFATMAAAETTPSAISAATQIHAPALVFSGANDCVAPPIQHQQPMYDSLASNCKNFISVMGASHCQFADFSSACYFGEGTCTPIATISAAQEKDLTLSLLLPWLDFYLKSDCNAGSTFQTLITNNSALAVQHNCSLLCLNTSIHEQFKPLSISIFPNPFSTETNIQFSKNISNGILTIQDMMGKEIKKIAVSNSSALKLQSNDLQNGTYFINIYEDNRIIAREKIMICR